MKPMKPLTTTEVEALIKRATPLPWFHTTGQDIVAKGKEIFSATRIRDGYDSHQRLGNSELAVFAVNHILPVMQERDKLKQERDAAVEALKYFLGASKHVSKFGSCAQGGEQEGNQMHIWEAEKIARAAIAKIEKGSK